MTKRKIIIGLIIFIIGLIGILTLDIPHSPEIEAALKDFTPLQKKLILIANPLIILLIATTLGTILYQKVNLKLPIIEKLVGMENDGFNFFDVIKVGILGGIVAGLLLSLIGLIFHPLLPNEFLELGESFQPTLAARFLYGGFTEEILMRFGLMTFVVWITSKIFSGTKPVVYWIGIIMASVFFAVGHFPIAFQAVESPSAGLLLFIFIGNTIGGLIFGWLYWKKGLESAFIAHIFAHVVMLLLEPLMSLS